jgi:hypothetical protein
MKIMHDKVDVIQKTWELSDLLSEVESTKKQIFVRATLLNLFANLVSEDVPVAALLEISKDITQHLQQIVDKEK